MDIDWFVDIVKGHDSQQFWFCVIVCYRNVLPHYGWIPNEQCLSYIMTRTSYFQWNDSDVGFVPDQHA